MTRPRFHIIAVVSLVALARMVLAVDSGYDGIPMEGPNGSRLQGANLANNSDSRLLDKDGYMKGKPKSIGRIVNPKAVLIAAPNWTPDVAVRLYTSVSKLPDHIHTIHVLYYSAQDFKSAKFIGYAILSPERKVTGVVKYDGADDFVASDASAWIKWLDTSLSKLKPEPKEGQK